LAFYHGAGEGAAEEVGGVVGYYGFVDAEVFLSCTLADEDGDEGLGLSRPGF
jgi:hypothetical protein